MKKVDDTYAVWLSSSTYSNFNMVCIASDDDTFRIEMDNQADAEMIVNLLLNGSKDTY